MQFDGLALAGILAKQEQKVLLRDANGYSCGEILPAMAVRVVEGGNYFGVGNRRRIRFLRPRTSSWRLSGGCRDYTRPVRADGTGNYYGEGQLLGNPKFLREHVPTR